MDRKVSLLVTQGRLEEERESAESAFWSWGGEFKVLDDALLFLITAAGGALILVGSWAVICRESGSGIIGGVMLLSAPVFYFLVSLFGWIRRSRNGAYRRWCYIKPSPYGQLILQLSDAIKQVNRREDAGTISRKESQGIVKSLEKARGNLWVSARQALGLVLDRPDSILRADALLQEVTQMVSDRKKALGELGVVA